MMLNKAPSATSTGKPLSARGCEQHSVNFGDQSNWTVQLMEKVVRRFDVVGWEYTSGKRHDR
jgi:hypothetical protein